MRLFIGFPGHVTAALIALVVGGFAVRSLFRSRSFRRWLRSLWGSSRTIYLVRSGTAMQNTLPRSQKRTLVWEQLRTRLEASGYRLRVATLFQVPVKNGGILFLDMHLKAIGHRHFKRLMRSNSRLILLRIEPPVVQPEAYVAANLSPFDVILTWDDRVVNRDRYRRVTMGYSLKPFYPWPKFGERKLCTMVCGNKSSSHLLELYSARRRVIEWFEDNDDADFEFFGTEWEELGYRNYRGVIGDKLACLSKYRFTFCYENTRDLKGYITEKIFDSLRAGSIPIYWGAPDICEFIPRECVILREEFSDHRQLYDYLESMSEDEFTRRQCAIDSYLRSEASRIFSMENYISAVSDALLSSPGSR